MLTIFSKTIKIQRWILSNLKRYIFSVFILLWILISYIMMGCYCEEWFIPCPQEPET